MDMPRFPVAFRLPALASWPSVARWGTGRPSRSAYRPCQQVPGPNGVVTLHTHEIRPERAPSLPRGRRCPNGRGVVPDRRLPHPSGKVPTPRCFSHRPGPPMTRHLRGFTVVRPPGLPLACGPRTGMGPLGFSPELHTPPLPAAHVEVGTGIGH